MNNIFEIEKLHDKVWVFKNAFKHSDDLVQYLEKQDNWTSWYVLGSKIALDTNSYKGDKFPSEEEWTRLIVNYPQHESLKEFVKTFYNISKYYVSELNIELENWVFTGSDVARYNSHSGVDDFRAMNYHTDHRLGRLRFPGHQFEITSVFYLNEGYDGGEICFRIFDDSLTTLLNTFDYKPNKGDIIMFPSKHPFYHGVKIVNSGKKYILRSYWRSETIGDPKLLEQKEKFLLTHTEKEWEEFAQQKENELFNRYQKRMQIITKEDPSSSFSELDKLDINPYSVDYEE